MIPKSILLITLLYVTIFSNAQEFSGAFIMSSVGLIDNFSNNSMAVTFSNSSSCLNIQNGVAILKGERGTDLFLTNCVEGIKFNKLGIKLFPNPVHESSKVKFINTPTLTDQFSISIWSVEGVKLISTIVTGFELFQGKIIDFSKLPNGSYIIQIESDKYIDALKVIKVK
jgi:hypothetical protein